MTLSDVRYDINHGAPRRILQPTLEAWAASHPSGAEILEVGAGHYDHRPFFNCRLTKFDADEAQSPDIVGDAHAMPMDDARFDGALAISVLEHVDDPYQVVREVFRVLKPGARVLAWIPFTFGVHGFPEDVSRFTTFGMRQLFARAGFEVTRIDEKPYAGAFLQASNLVHFVLPRTSRRRLVRGLNKGLFLTFRAGYPLDRRLNLRLRTLYTGAEIEARKPAAR
ncbi:MAG: methyltransferase domain-containing protein [Solirubrobacterales bacterium]|nr:methyltransferase domain-containing protein [Solirubrobacterales bacterium]